MELNHNEILNQSMELVFGTTFPGKIIEISKARKAALTAMAEIDSQRRNENAQLRAELAGHLEVKSKSQDPAPDNPWIKVTETPPELHVDYLVSTPYCTYPSLPASFDGEKWTDVSGGEVLGVNYYMPLPYHPEFYEAKKGNPFFAVPRKLSREVDKTAPSARTGEA